MNADINNILLEILQNDKNKISYINTTLSKFSERLKEVLNSSLSDKMKKYSLRLIFEDFENNIKTSKLKNKELSFTLNLLYGRYRKYLEKI